MIIPIDDKHRIDTDAALRASDAVGAASALAELENLSRRLTLALAPHYVVKASTS